MTRPPFLVDVVALRRHQGRRETLQTRDHLDGLRVTGSEVLPTSDLTVEVTMEALEGAIAVRGVVSAPWVGECRRCLKPIRGELRAEVEELFVRDAEEGETYPIEGDQIDLTAMAREAVVLALPNAPLCRENCLGLCPDCGADLNDGPCACPAAPTDSRWSALDAMRPDS
jgi:uncharacterized protein